MVSNYNGSDDAILIYLVRGKLVLKCTSNQLQIFKVLVRVHRYRHVPHATWPLVA
jgi:hypothetical protein